ncbi:MAG: 50S ribosomal protein L22 [Candidatus Thermochlorobacter aerophilum]|jgi:large subunit ribosomal protein L22|uniref:Large ribosomal subunit protein uL22 n=1 Tax=Candidatus Thermochlorobacter aerophilus TaxID=1868324 RepID=A0A395LWD7_9BACT|nr:MAG: 50S ribosomal protein L22 [Candidatus Thermochlorobacter aerophilum]
MGARKRKAAEARKEARRNATRSVAVLRHTPTSPRKMRLVVDLVRGKDVETATAILQNSTKHAARTVLRTLKSAVSNYMNRNNETVSERDLYIVEAYVNAGVTLKRIAPAPMGRAYRIRKRSNHLTIVVDKRKTKQDSNANKKTVAG